MAVVVCMTFSDGALATQRKTPWSLLSSAFQRIVQSRRTANLQSKSKVIDVEDPPFVSLFTNLALDPTYRVLDYLAHGRQGALSCYALLCQATYSTYQIFKGHVEKHPLEYPLYQWRPTKKKLVKTTFDFGGLISTAKHQIAIGSDKSLYITQPRSLMKVTPTGDVVTIAQLGPLMKVTPTGDIEPVTYVEHSRMMDDSRRSPRDIAVDRNGNIYLTDYHGIFKITPEGRASLFIDSDSFGAHTRGVGNGDPPQVSIGGPDGVAVSKKDGAVYIADTGNLRILKVVKGKSSVYVDDTQMQGSPTSLVLDSSDNLFFIDHRFADSRILRVTKDGSISTYFKPGGNYLASLVIDGQNNIYAVYRHMGNNHNTEPSVVKITPDGKSTALSLPEETLHGSVRITSIAISSDGSILYAVDAVHKVVHAFHLGFPRYGDHV